MISCECVSANHTNLFEVSLSVWDFAENNNFKLKKPFFAIERF